MDATYHTSSGTTHPGKYCALTTYIPGFSSVVLWTAAGLDVLHLTGLA